MGLVQKTRHATYNQRPFSAHFRQHPLRSGFRWACAGTLASQFDFVNILVRPLDDDTYEVSMLRKDVLPEFSALTEPKVLSERSVATFVRQVALLANHMSILHVRSMPRQTHVVFFSLPPWPLTPTAACIMAPQSQAEYTSNFTNRLRQIRRIGERNLEAHGAAEPAGGAARPAVTGSVPLATLSHVADFTVYS